MIHLRKNDRVAIIQEGVKLAEAYVLEPAWEMGVAAVRLILGTGPAAKQRQVQISVCYEYLAHVV